MQTDSYSFPLLSLQLYELTLYLKRYGLFVYEKAKQTVSVSDDIEAVMEYINLNFHLPISLEDAAEKAKSAAPSPAGSPPPPWHAVFPRKCTALAAKRSAVRCVLKIAPPRKPY